MAKAPGPRPEGHAPVNTNETGTLVVNGTLVINGGTVIINSGTLIVGGQAGAPKGLALPGHPMAKPMGNKPRRAPMLNARVLFDRLDTNKDGKLSFDEFDVAVRHLQRFLAMRMGEMKRPLSDGMQAFGEKWGNSAANPAASAWDRWASIPAWDRWAVILVWDRWVNIPVWE